jgi:pre-mRNA-processing factor 17
LYCSAADDKTIRVWEFGVPVQTQCIQDPSLHAIASASLTCNENYLLGQSANNQVVTYSLGNAVRQNRKKTFAGHVSAGYACQVGVSHDDKFVFSGDGDGKVFIWSWKSKKVRTVWVNLARRLVDAR